MHQQRQQQPQTFSLHYTLLLAVSLIVKCLAGVKAQASAPAAPEAAVAAATTAITNGAPGSTHDDPVLSPSSFVRFMPDSTAVGQGGQLSMRTLNDGPGVERSDRSADGPGDLPSGFSMLGSAMPSFELMQRMRKSLSPEELQSAFARRWVPEVEAKAGARTHTRRVGQGAGVHRQVDLLVQHTKLGWGHTSSMSKHTKLGRGRMFSMLSSAPPHCELRQHTNKSRTRQRNCSQHWHIGGWWRLTLRACVRDRRGGLGSRKVGRGFAAHIAEGKVHYSMLGYVASRFEF
jgi:hypothetical protein